MASVGTLLYAFLLASEFRLQFDDHPRKGSISSRINRLIYKAFIINFAYILQIFLYEIFNTFILKFKTFQ